MKIWTFTGILTHGDLEVTEKRVSQIQSSIDIGRLPLNIGSRFARFTAEQWLNWVAIYLPVAFKGVVPPAHLRCWLPYIRTCSVLCSKVIESQMYKLQINACTISVDCSKHCMVQRHVHLIAMHLHLHLKESLLDYGPVYAFWLFAFEQNTGSLLHQ